MTESELKRIMKNRKAKGYRENDIHSFETYVSDNGKSLNLGTYDTERKAKNAVGKYRFDKFVDKVSKTEENVYSGKLFDSNYVVYPDGNIFNLHGKRMVGAVGRDGYRHTNFNGKNTDIHRVIAKLFVPNPNNDEQVNHKNGIKSDNRAENLEWCSRSENLKHAYKNGLEIPKYGENHPNHKLTEDAVRYIRENAKAKDKEFGYTALGRKFGVDRTVIADVVDCKTWRNVE